MERDLLEIIKQRGSTRAFEDRLPLPGKTSGGSGKAFLQRKNLWSEGEQRKKSL
jgi:hypothetical protein